LIDKSLVVAHLGAAGGGRYRLVEVIRQYAAARLDAAERAECRRWHRDYYADRAGRLDPDRARPIVGEPPRWFADEHDNLRVALAAALADDPEQALRLATSTWRFWMSRGLIEEGVRWLRRALDAHPERSTLRAAALYGLAVLSTRLGQGGPLDGIGAELVAIAADGGDRADLAAAHHQQTVLAFMAGDWPRTDTLQAQTLVEAAKVPTVLTSTLHVAAILAISRGELEDAGRRLAEAGGAIAAVPESADPFLITMSPAFVVERRAGWAYVIGEETMWLARRVGRAQATAHLLLTRAMHARLGGDLDGSLQLLQAAAAAFRSLGDRYGQALTVAQRGHALRWAGDPEASRSCFETAEALRRTLGDLRGVALALDGQALADAVDGRSERALLLGGRALAGMRRGGDVAGIGFTAWNLAAVHVLLGDLPSAAELLEHPAVGPDSPGWQRPVGWNRLLLADIWRRLGEPRHEAAAAAAQEMFTRLGDRAGLAELRSVRAKGMQSGPS
jgi:tetratricopeptide (TPR) repeat protein